MGWGGVGCGARVNLCAVHKYDGAGSSFNAPVYFAAPADDQKSIFDAGRPALEHFRYTYRNYTSPRDFEPTRGGHRRKGKYA